MKLLADLRRWVGGALDWLYPVDLVSDPLTAIQREAIERNRAASVENCVAARATSDVLSELLAKMETKTP